MLREDYQPKIRANLLTNLKECIQSLIDERKGLLNQDIKNTEIEFTKTKFTTSTTENSNEIEEQIDIVIEVDNESEANVTSAMPVLKNVMQEQLDIDHIKLIVSAVEKLNQSKIRDSRHFRAAVLYVIIMIGENCKVFSGRMKEQLPINLLKFLSYLRNSIIHASDKSNGRIQLTNLLENSNEDLMDNVLKELTDVLPFFKNAIDKNNIVNEINVYDLKNLNRLRSALLFETEKSNEPSMLEPLILVQKYMDEELVEATDPCHIYAIHFYMVYIGEMARWLEFNMLFNKATEEKMQNMIEMLVDKRGQLVHQLTARGLAGSKQLIQSCIEIKKHQTAFQCIDYAIELIRAINKYRWSSHLLIVAYNKLIKEINENVVLLTRIKDTSGNTKGAKLLGNVAHVQLSLLQEDSSVQTSSKELTEIFINVWKFDTDQYNTELSPSKIQPSDSKDDLVKFKTSPQKLLSYNAEHLHNKLIKKYKKISEELLQLQYKIENLIEKLDTSFSEPLQKLLKSCEQIRLNLETTLQELPKVRDFSQFRDSHFSNTKAPLCQQSTKKMLRLLTNNSLIPHEQQPNNNKSTSTIENNRPSKREQKYHQQKLSKQNSSLVGKNDKISLKKPIRNLFNNDMTTEKEEFNRTRNSNFSVNFSGDFSSLKNNLNEENNEPSSKKSKNPNIFSKNKTKAMLFREKPTSTEKENNINEKGEKEKFDDNNLHVPDNVNNFQSNNLN